MEEIDSLPTDHTDSEYPVQWDTSWLRRVKYDALKSSVISGSGQLRQVHYPMFNHQDEQVFLRRSIGLPIYSPLGHFLWFTARYEGTHDLEVAIDPSWIFSQTEGLVNARILDWSWQTHPNWIFDFIVNSLQRLLLSLNITLDQYKPNHEPVVGINNYLAVDQESHPAFMLLIGNHVLMNSIEKHIKSYCESHWARYSMWGQRIHFSIDIYLRLRKKRWNPTERNELKCGDLLAIENVHATDTSSRRLRGYMKFSSRPQHTFEVYLTMNANDSRIEFGRDDLNEEPTEAATIAPHEEIEIELYAGRTKILFDELCAVQEGTLIELREHALPMVTLCINGRPFFEGELVQFQDQIMVQITRTLG